MLDIEILAVEPVFDAPKGAESPAGRPLEPAPFACFDLLAASRPSPVRAGPSGSHPRLGF